jgi:hypothetical protein
MRTVWLLGVLSVTAGSLQAQGSLPVSGTVTYNAILYDQADGTDARSTGFRFAGRIAARLTRGTYLGLGVGSWSRRTGANCSVFPSCGDRLQAQSEAVVHQVYVQQYVRGRAFARGGAGLAVTSTLQSLGTIVVDDRWRAALSAGIGMDVPVGRFLYLTPSLDATLLPGTDRQAQELRSGIALGVGLTLR